MSSTNYSRRCHLKCLFDSHSRVHDQFRCRSVICNLFQTIFLNGVMCVPVFQTRCITYTYEHWRFFFFSSFFSTNEHVYISTIGSRYVVCPNKWKKIKQNKLVPYFYSGSFSTHNSKISYCLFIPQEIIFKILVEINSYFLFEIYFRFRETTV